MDKKFVIIHATAILVVVILLAGGFYAGFIFGNKKGFSAGKEQGFKDGQKAALEIQEAANPYNDLENAANPFQQEYENPF